MVESSAVRRVAWRVASLVETMDDTWADLMVHAMVALSAARRVAKWVELMVGMLAAQRASTTVEWMAVETDRTWAGPKAGNLVVEMALLSVAELAVCSAAYSVGMKAS